MAHVFVTSDPFVFTAATLPNLSTSRAMHEQRTSSEARAAQLPSNGDNYRDQLAPQGLGGTGQAAGRRSRWRQLAGSGRRLRTGVVGSGSAGRGDEQKKATRIASHVAANHHIGADEVAANRSLGF
ncbi:hypothetical protein HYQ46_009265 [Verticillium longisporum]|nr:hypothetical protein HYQ44_010185 [Verticillium longisporum]KAG7133668.1 hypothetical protein HYQ46_009265 [Verticillium longisporum]